MPVSPERVDQLQDYGLTEYESRAYCALLDLEVAEASQVAEVARVPRTKIYEALDGLEEKRLVRVVPERPKKFVVEPIENHLENLESRYRSKAEEIEEARDDLADEYAPEGHLDPQEAGTFEAFEGRSSAQNRLLEAVDEAEDEITIVTSGPGLHRVAYHAGRFGERDDVDVRVLCPADAAGDEDLEAVADVAEVRHAPIQPGPATLVLVDRDAVTISHHVPDDEQVFQGSDPGVWTDDPGVVELLTALVAGAWSMARDAETEDAPRPAKVNGHLDLAGELQRVIGVELDRAVAN